MASTKRVKAGYYRSALYFVVKTRSPSRQDEVIDLETRIAVLTQAGR